MIKKILTFYIQSSQFPSVLPDYIHHQLSVKFKAKKPNYFNPLLKHCCIQWIHFHLITIRSIPYFSKFSSLNIFKQLTDLFIYFFFNRTNKQFKKLAKEQEVGNR